MTIRNFLYPSPKKESKPIIVEKKVYIKRSFLFEFSRVLIVLATVTAITWGITRAQTDEAPAQESIPEETTPAPQEAPADEPAQEETTPAEQTPVESEEQTPVESEEQTPTETPDSTTITSTEEESNGILGSIIDTFTDIGSGITDAISNTLNTVSDLLTSTSTLPIQEEPTASSTAPILFAEQETETGKLVTVSSPEEDPNNPHTDVLASTTIPEIYSVGEEDKIQIKWKNNGEQEMSFRAYDTDNNGKLDYIEWTIPHLSTQIFEIIFISKAFHLDTDQTILADIYDTVKTQDNTYASLSNGQYIRATFERILDNTKDITVYAKATNSESPASIEVFPLYEDELGNLTEGPSIATFPSITEEGTYKVLLTNLETPTDRFDLKVSGSIEVDLVIDPTGFTAVQAGAIDDGATFGNTSPGTEGIDFPGATDQVDIAGFNLTVPTAMTIDTLTNSSSTSVGSVDLSASFTVTNTVTDIPFTVSGTGIVMDVNIVNTVLDNAIYINSGAEVTIAGDIDNQYGNGVNNSGIITDVSGTITNSGGVYSIYNDSQGSILSGNFTGSEFYNSGNISGGTFTGDNFVNPGDISGGTFTGSNFANNGNIYGGTFSGDSFTNNGFIYGGSWAESYTLDTITNGPYTNPGFNHQITLLNLDTRLYWKNVANDGEWNNTSNWFTDPQATIQADNAPWVDGVDTTYLAYNLSRAYGETSAPTIDTAIGTGVTGSSDISGLNTYSSPYGNAQIYGGTFTGDNFVNPGDIFGGTFTGDNFYTNNWIGGGTFTGDNFTNNWILSGGTFTGDNFTNTDGEISSGTFSGDGFSNSSDITGGTFTGDNFTNSGTINGGTFSGDSFTNNGFIYGGSWAESYTLDTITNGPYTNPGFNHQITLLDLDTRLYWKNISTDYSWNNTLNWFTDPEATIQADNAPWVDGVDTAYLAYNLTLANGETGAPTIDTAIGTGVTGSSDISGLNTYSYPSSAQIYGGTFTGDNFVNLDEIFGGTFTGNNFTNNYNIYGGTFTGDSFTNSGLIHTGTFIGDSFTNTSDIYGGTFSGDSFTNNGSISGGSWAESYTLDTITNGPYTNPGFNHQITLLDLDTRLYWKNISTDYSWNNTLNWFTDPEATIQADNAPWVDGVDTAYLAYNLTLANGETGAPTIDTAIGTGVTGSSDIGRITNNSDIYGGTFTGNNFTNCYNEVSWVSVGCSINGGTFTGNNFTNGYNNGSYGYSYGYIYGGIFTGNNFTNGYNNGYYSYTSSSIYGGTFTGDNFTNGYNNGSYGYSYGYIYGGIFTGDGFSGSYDNSGYGNTYGNIYEGLFMGDGFTNSIDNTISGGTFTGDNFTNSGTIYGGSWAESYTLDTITNGPYTNPGFNHQITLLNLDTSLYWKNISGDSSWNNTSNWFTDPEATIQADNAPWVDGVDTTYLAYNLFKANGETGSPTINTAIGTGVTGLSFIYSISNSSGGTVNGGNFLGAYFTNNSGGIVNDGNFLGYSFSNYYGTIYGGLFTGWDFNNYYGTIYDGTFTGGNFYNNYYSSIYGGTFTGDYFNNYYYSNIYGGTFTGYGFYNSYYSNIYGGTFAGDNFYNDSYSTITGGTFSGDNFNNYSTITDGTWALSYSKNGIIYGPYTNPGFPNEIAMLTLDTNLYWKNIGGDYTWSNPLNWFIDPEATIQAANAPWVDGVDITYLGGDLSLANGETGAPTIDAPIGTDVTGSSDIPWISNSSDIYGGTFTGDNFTNSGYIYGGTFTGVAFTNNNYIYGGIFTGDSFVNNSTISGGSWVESYTQDTVTYGPYTNPGFPHEIPLLNFDTRLYWKNAAGDNSWSNPLNWFTNPEATIQADNAPWVNGVDTTYLAYYLSKAKGETGSLSIDVPIGTDVTGYSDIQEIANDSEISGGTFMGAYFINSTYNYQTYTYGIIFGGTFTGSNFYNNNEIYDGTFIGYSFANNSSIYSGIFSGDNFNNSYDSGSYGSISGGTFTGDNFNNGSINGGQGSIYGGTFSGDNFNNGSVYGNNSYIYGGLFIGDNFINNTNAPIFGGTFTGDNFTNSGSINGGSWALSYIQGGNTYEPYTNPGFPDEIAVLNLDTSLYWKNISGDSSWNNTSNWFTDPEATIQADNAPWIDGVDTTYLAYNLFKAGGSGAPMIDTAIGTDVTGFSFINDINNSSGGTVNGGNFLGAWFYNNYGSIYDGTFLGYGFNNSYGNIYGGTITGMDFYNNSGSIHGGTFTGDYFYNDYFSTIYSGIFTGDSFNNGYNSNIYGGIFTGDGFNNGSSITGGTWALSYIQDGNTYEPYTNPGGFPHEIPVVNLDLPIHNAAINSGYLDIDSCGSIISPGTYTLNTNLEINEGSCITILSSDVILDGAGMYSITNNGINPGENAIEVLSGYTGIYIQSLDIYNTGAGAALYNYYGGTIEDMSGTIINTGSGESITNGNSSYINNLSGKIYNSPTGTYSGLENTSITGNIINLPLADGYIWTNRIGDHNWDDAENWLPKVVPNKTTDNIILGADMILPSTISNPVYFAPGGFVLYGAGSYVVENNIYGIDGTSEIGINPATNGSDITLNEVDWTGSILAGNADLSTATGGSVTITKSDLDVSNKSITAGIGATNGSVTLNYNSLITDTATYLYEVGALVLNGTQYTDTSGNSLTCTNGVSVGLGCAWNGVFNPLIFYFNNAVDTDWNTLGNWWNDTDFTVPASILPTGVDQVFIFGEIVTGINAYAGTIVFNGTSTSAIDIAVSKNAIFNDESSNSGNITLSEIATFNDSSSNTGSIAAATSTFNALSSNTGSVTSVTSTFYEDLTSTVGGTVIGFIQRIFTSSAISIRDFTTEGGRDDWTIISTGVTTVVDLSGAIYDLATNIFKGLLGGSFVENEGIVTAPFVGEFIPRDSSRNWRLITSSADGSKLAAVVTGGQIYTSTDSGVTWTAQASGSRSWRSITSSSDGTKLAAAVYGGQIYTSLDSGVTWTARDSSRQWFSITSSADGTKLAAVVYNGQIYTSTDSGVTWTARDSSRQWFSITSSADGTKLAAVVYNGQIYTSTDSGITWTARDSNRSWFSITSSADGAKLATTVYGGQIYTSTNSGVTWTAQASGSRDWRSITSSADGAKLAAVVQIGQIYTSNDSGVTWTARDSSRQWFSITSSADGTKIAAVVYGGQIYTSTEVSGTGLDVVPSVTITSPIPTTSGDTTKWAPDIDWGTAVSCEYSYDNYVTMNTLDCAQEGADLPQPTAMQDHTLYIRAIDNHGGLTEKSVTYRYNNTVPTYTMCGDDLLDEATRPYYYLTANTSNTCTASVPVTLWGNASSTISGYTLSGDYVSNGNAITFNNITTSGDVTGTPTYTNNAVNSGTVFGNTIFNNTSYNSGTVLGTARFNAYTANASSTVTVAGDTDFKGTGIVSGLIKDSAGNTITSWILSNGSVLSGVLIGQTTFNDTSQNNGTVMSSATTTFNGDMASSTGDVLSAYINSYQDWTAQSAGNRNWYVITSTPSGNVYATVSGGDIYKQTGGTGSFVAQSAGNRNWFGLTSTPSGNVYASAYGGDIYKQTGGTGSFVAQSAGNKSWRGLTSTPNGDVYAAVQNGDIYKQTGGTGSFVAQSAGNRDWYAITSTPSGNVYASAYGGDIYKQTGGTGSFVAQSAGNRAWGYGITSTPNGDVYAAVMGGDIYKQTGGTGSFVAQSAGNKNWRGLTSTPNGDVYAAVQNADIYKQTGGTGAFDILNSGTKNWLSITHTPNGYVYATAYGDDIYKLSPNIVQPQSTSTPITRIFTSAASTTRNFLTEAGRNNWIIVAQGAAVDISNAIYDTATNIFKAILDPITKIAGTFFWGSNPGGQVVPQITIATTTIPYTGNINYTASKTLKWNPHVDWDTATTCIYSYNSDFSSPITTTCSSDDTSLARPSAGDQTIYLRGTDALGNISETSRRFYYDNTSPVWTSCGADLLDEATRPYYYLATSTSNTCTATVDTKLFGNIYTTESTVSGTGFSIGAVQANGNSITLKNITVTSTATSNGGTITIQNATTSDVVVSGNGNGANAGSITIATSTTGTLYANGANGTADGGDGGNITITNSIGTNASSTPIFANGGSSTSCGNGGDAGLVTLTNSTYGTITANGGNANETGCPGSGKTSGQSRTVGNGITVSGSYTPPGSGSTNTNTNTNTNTGGGSSTGGVLRDLIKNVVNPIIFDPLPSFSPFSPGFTPQNIGATVIPNPFIGFNMPGSFGLIKLPVNFITNVSNFLFAPLPQPITDALSSSPRLAAYIGATTLLTEQELAYLTQSPAKLETPTEDIPGLFIIKSGEQTLTAYATYDKAVGGLAQLVKVSPNQTLTISLVPQSTGEVTATYLDQTLLFSKSSRYASTYLTTPASAGRYVLKSSSSPLPLLIEVITPTQTSEKKPWGIFNFLYNWLH